MAPMPAGRSAAAATPASLTLEYGDGNVVTVPFASLTTPLREELLRQPFALSVNDLVTPSGDGSAGADDRGRFLLLEWDDGWREVRRVPASCTGVGRYYVISRTEETGRLALTTDSDYPELVEVTRRPSRLRRVTLDGTLVLNEATSAREGGKTDHFYAITPDGDALADLRAALEAAAAEEGIDLGALSAERVERLRRRLQLNASFAQRDVVEFVVALALVTTADGTSAVRPH